MGFRINDLVVHCRDGLATIISIIKMAEKDFYLVRAARGDGENIYVPFDRADSIIRPLMNEKEADQLCKHIKSIAFEFNCNTKQRRDSYKKRLSTGNTFDIAYLFRQLWFFKRLPEGDPAMKLGPVDLDMLGHASNILLDEFAITYNVDRAEIERFIDKKIK